MARFDSGAAILAELTDLFRRGGGVEVRPFQPDIRLPFPDSGQDLPVSGKFGCAGAFRIGQRFEWPTELVKEWINKHKEEYGPGYVHSIKVSVHPCSGVLDADFVVNFSYYYEPFANDALPVVMPRKEWESILDATARTSGASTILSY